MATNTVPVGTVAALVFAPQANAQNLVLTNVGTDLVYLGQSGVTAALGFPLAPGQTLSLPVVNTNIYAIAGTDNVVTPTSVLSGGVSAAGVALPVASGGTSFTNGMSVAILDGAKTEIVTVGAGSTGTSVVVSALAFAHNSATAFGQFASTNASAVSVTSGT